MRHRKGREILREKNKTEKEGKSKQKQKKQGEK
jgi:hypothetical protein